MLSALLPTTRRARRSAKAKQASARRANRALRVENLEDRKLLTTAPFFSGLGDLPGGAFDSRGLGISDDGQTVVGDANIGDTTQEAFRWTEETGIQGLGVLPGATTSGARKASADGRVIVGRSDSGSTVSFRWENGTMEEIPDLPGEQGGPGFTAAHDVSDDGTVVVGATPSTLGTQAYVWKQGQGTTALGDLDGGSFHSIAIGVTGDGSTVVGWGTNVENSDQAVRWTETEDPSVMQMEALEDSGIQSRARDVSADGSVVVGWDRLSLASGRGKKFIPSAKEAYRWTQATGMEHLGDLDGGDRISDARAVSADGSVIAGLSHSSNGAEAFVWDESHGMRSLQDVLASDFGLNLTGWQLTHVYDMTPDGLNFVGIGFNPNGDREGFIAGITPPGAGITVTPSSGLQTSEDGDTGVIDVVLDAEPTAPVTIDVSSSNTAEGEIVGATGGVVTLTFDATNWDDPQSVTVQGVEDNGELDGDQGYSIQLDPSSVGDADYDALITVVVSATNLDNEAPPVSAMFVADISMFTTSGNKVKHHIEVLVMQDNGANDVPLAGVQVTVTFANKTFTGVTDNNGIFRSAAIKGVKSGEYEANVVDLALTDFDWALALDLEDDSDGDGWPDDTFTI